MATPAERAERKHHHRAGRHHHTNPDRIARERIAAQRRGAVGYAGSSYTNAPTSGPAPGPMDVPDQSGHLNPEQFVGYPGGFSTDVGNMTGVEALAGAEGNGGAGGTGGDAGGAAS